MQIDNATYVDGGLRTVAPLKPAIDIGCDKIYVILCNPAEYPAKNYIPGDIMNDIDRYFSIITDATITNDIKFAEYVNINLKDPNSYSSQNGKRILDIKVIRPTKEVNVDLSSFTEKDIRELVMNGRYIGQLFFG